MSVTNGIKNQSGFSDDTEHKVESIVGTGYNNEDKLCYEVYWKGWPSSENTWSQASRLQGCASVI